MKRFIAIAATTICCLGNEMPAKADYNFAGGALYAVTCKQIDGTITEQQAALALSATLSKHNIPAYYGSAEKTKDVARSLFIQQGGCI